MKLDSFVFRWVTIANGENCVRPDNKKNEKAKDTGSYFANLEMQK